jgi:hypothetical protein
MELKKTTKAIEKDDLYIFQLNVKLELDREERSILGKYQGGLVNLSLDGWGELLNLEGVTVYGGQNKFVPAKVEDLVRLQEGVSFRSPNINAICEFERDIDSVIEDTKEAMSNIKRYLLSNKRM